MYRMKHKAFRVTHRKHLELLAVHDGEYIILCIGKRDFAMSKQNAKAFAKFILEVTA
jgi:hypothetical protein